MGQTQFRSDDTVKWWLAFGNGSDGDYSSVGNATDAPVDSSCSGTATSTSLSATNASFANGKPILIHQTRGTGAGNWELNQIDSYTAGTITLKKALQNTYTDSGASQAQVIQLKQYKSFTQNSGHTLTAKAWNGDVGGIIAFLAKGTTTINGTISAVGRGFRGGYGSYQASNSHGTQAEGSGADRGTQSKSANGNGGGGGMRETSDGAINSGGGGGGGNSSSGSNGSSGTQGGTGGTAGGGSGLTTSVFGGGGGGAGGKYENSGDDQKGANGATGAGMVFIFSDNISITGSVNTNGSNGSTINNRGGSGGSAGGSVLLKCKTATLGTNKIVSSGSSGGSSGSWGSPGGGGSVGRIHLDYSGSYTGTTSPTLDATLDPTIKAGGADFFAFF